MHTIIAWNNVLLLIEVTPAKTNWGPLKFGANSSKLGQKLQFLPFSQVWFMGMFIRGSVVDIGKTEKTIFCCKNDPFITKGIEIFRKHLSSTVLQKLKKSFHYTEMTSHIVTKFIIYLAFKKSVLKTYHVNSTLNRFLNVLHSIIILRIKNEMI